MLVEVLVRWTEMRFKPNGGGDAAQDYVNKLISGTDNEPTPTHEAEIHYQYQPMVFNTDDVSRWNAGTEPLITTVRFKDGDAYVVKYPYESFSDMMSDALDKSITSLKTVMDIEEALDDDEDDEIEL